MRRGVVAISFFVALLAAWQAMVISGRWSPVLLPEPTSVAAYLWGAAADGSLFEATSVTLRRLILGYAIGVYSAKYSASRLWKTGWVAAGPGVLPIRHSAV